MSNTIPGGWTGWSYTVTEEAFDVFRTALEGFVGVKYTPLAYATQVVSGTNYCFMCKGEVTYPDAPELTVKMYIYAPLQGDPHITQIVDVGP